jgi:hypothetical protein
VSALIKHTKIDRIEVMGVVEVVEETSPEEIELCERRFRVETRCGETLELVLQAEMDDELVIHTKPVSDWLNPKLYKPKEQR